MKKKGFTLIELLVVIAIIAMLLAILMPALNKVKKIAQRVVCGTNLKGLGTAQAVYGNDYDDAYVVQSATGAHTWSTRTTGFSNPAKPWGNPGNITVGASLYLLVREADVSPKSFICGAGGQNAYDGQNGGGRDITELWDFGVWQTDTPAGPDIGIGPTHGPREHVSYSYQMPYGVAPNFGAGRFAADGTKSAAFAVMADKNPWMDPKISTVGVPQGADWEDNINFIGFYWVNASAEKWKLQIANAYPHSREGQNVLFGDGHSAYEKVTDIGVKHDGIYTIRGTNGDEASIRRGDEVRMLDVTIDNQYQPNGVNDSFLVNDDSRGAPY